MIVIKNKEQIEGIRTACRLARGCLLYLEQYIFIGQNTEELNRLAHEFIIGHNAVPAPLNYRNFPKSICTSINDVVCHGIPSEKDILRSGDIVNVDITVNLHGFFGDTSKTYIIGEVADDVRYFVERVEKCMYRGIEVLKPGVMLNIMGKTIETYIQKFGYSAVRDYGGHGIGLAFHEDPHVCHFYTKANKIVLKEGMTFTVEPMINKSKYWQVVTCDKDGWTCKTKDGSLSAQFEHTVLITKDGCEVLTGDDF